MVIHVIFLINHSKTNIVVTNIIILIFNNYSYFERDENQNVRIVIVIATECSENIGPAMGAAP